VLQQRVPALRRALGEGFVNGAATALCRGLAAGGGLDDALVGMGDDGLIDDDGAALREGGSDSERRPRGQLDDAVGADDGTTARNTPPWRPRSSTWAIAPPVTARALTRRWAAELAEPPCEAAPMALAASSSTQSGRVRPRTSCRITTARASRGSRRMVTRWTTTTREA
jgi:hypothetical protein